MISFGVVLFLLPSATAAVRAGGTFRPTEPEHVSKGRLRVADQATFGNESATKDSHLTTSRQLRPDMERGRH